MKLNVLYLMFLNANDMHYFNPGVYENVIIILGVAVTKEIRNPAFIHNNNRYNENVFFI
jgi:hypothetical protein